MQNPVFFFNAYKNRFMKLQPQDIQELRELSQEVFMRLQPDTSIDGIVVSVGEWRKFKRHDLFITRNGIWVQCNDIASMLIPAEVKRAAIRWTKTDPEYVDTSLYGCFFPQLGVRAFVEGKAVINCAQFVRLHGI